MRRDARRRLGEAIRSSLALPMDTSRWRNYSRILVVTTTRRRSERLWPGPTSWMSRTAPAVECICPPLPWLRACLTYERQAVALFCRACRLYN